MEISEYKNMLTSGSLQAEYFKILSDKNFHCRKCAQKMIGSEQLAGGGGVQGLQRGTKNRPGLVIETISEYCSKCKKITKWDRWTGEFKQSNSAAGISVELQKKILNHYAYTDSIEQRKRQAHELVIDHRHPMERWGESEEHNNIDMTDDEIQHKYQLLKKDVSGNHNLLKSRACERCIATGKRGYPMGIKYYYAGDENWPDDCPTNGKDSERGCIGCGWYDFETWRKSLNEQIK